LIRSQPTKGWRKTQDYAHQLKLVHVINAELTQDDQELEEKEYQPMQEEELE